MKKHWRSRSFIFSDEDVAVFSSLLKSAFTNIRFLMSKYCEEQDTSPDSIGEPAIPYRETLNGPANFSEMFQTAWLEPEGWRPVWSKRVAYGFRFIENLPPLSFTWLPSPMGYGSWLGNEGRMTLRLGEVTAHVAQGDRDHAAFVNKVWRLIAQISTNKTPWCYHDLVTGEIHGPFVADQIWIGHEALKWVREDPRHCFFHRHRPADSIGIAPTGVSSESAKM